MGKELLIDKKIFHGINDGRKAYCGPHTVQIDLTDRCNNNCLCCWVHSPLLDKKEIFPHGEQELSFPLAEKLIKELLASGTKDIILSGSGEPFVYPHITDVIELIKSQDVYLNIINNGILLNEKMCELLVARGVNLLTVSIWAGSASVYTALHPNQSEATFERIRGNLKRIAAYKRARKALAPHIKIYNVICSKNYSDIEAMVDFAKDVEADSMEFQIVDIIKGKTDELALQPSQAQEILKQFEKIKQRKDLVFFGNPETQKTNLQDNSFVDLGKVWIDHKEGFTVKSNCASLVCKKGHEMGPDKQRVVSSSTSTIGTYPTTFRYQFVDETCTACEEKTSCLDGGVVSVRFLNILNAGFFAKKLVSNRLTDGIYETEILSRPCYMGWYYARILTSGDVIPCCKAALHPLGNIARNSFDEIWNSAQYRQFRHKAKTASKNDPYFEKINCIKSCDNGGMNASLGNKLVRFFEEEGIVETVRKRGGVVFLAKDFAEGSLNVSDYSFGENIVIDGGKQEARARYEFTVRQDGNYEFRSRYASNESRPVDIFIDKKLVKKDGLSFVTGGWVDQFLKWYTEFEIELRKGKHSLEIVSVHCVPHIEKFALVKKKSSKRHIRNIVESIIPGNCKDKYLELLGVYDGRFAYKGPFHVQIDLTNNCNNNCIACWCNSPLLKDKKLSQSEKAQELPLPMARELLDDIARMGAIEVYFSGSGEPFMHPHIMEILEYAKKKNLICHVNTNFTLLDKKKLDCLIAIGVDTLTVSTWAASAHTYAKTHPNKAEQDFFAIRDNLIYLNSRKKEKPFIKLYNVLFNMNYGEVEAMVRFAAETKSESLEFTLVDTIPGATDALSLNSRQLKGLVSACQAIKARCDAHNVLKDNGVLLFQFDQFLRRISVAGDAQEAKYDRNIIDTMPCYIGWLFARVIPTGEVHSCLKAHRIPTGSLYRNTFSEIWNSKAQMYFRKKTLVCKKKDPFFALIGNDPTTKEAGCYKSCDDIGRNTWMHKHINALNFSQRVFIKGVATGAKIKRMLQPKKENQVAYHSDPVIAGIMHGRKAFVGPEQVVIDPTNRCNLQCAACWLYSPFLTKDKPDSGWLKKELSKKTLIRLIDDLALLRTKKIRFTGGGEPFLHSGLFDVIAYAKSKGIEVAVTTNFGILSTQQVQQLLALGVEELAISLWGSNAATYQKVHPGVGQGYFEKIKENLVYLKEHKKQLPRVTFANVLMNSNCDDFESMYQFGIAHRADAVYFTLADVFAGQTDACVLEDSQRSSLLEKALALRARNESAGSLALEFFDGFIRRLSVPKSEFTHGLYDKAGVNKIPCYVGWIFARILADGSVAPCCRAVKKIMGNINEQSFKKIWFSPKYNEFRGRAKYLSKEHPYFYEVGCLKECDNLMHNEQMHHKILFPSK